MTINNELLDEYYEIVYRAMTQQSGNSAQALSHASYQEAKTTALGLEARQVAHRTLDWFLSRLGRVVYDNYDPTNTKARPVAMGNIVFIPYERPD